MIIKITHKETTIEIHEPKINYLSSVNDLLIRMSNEIIRMNKNNENTD
tara:strand:+ start:697 stop:840 length:144 start_codon:yes stop_codon:yes gene_type:complete